jgi:hypothetical protein
MSKRRQGTNAALESYDETLSASYIARQQARESEAQLLESRALEADQNASEWEHDDDDCGCHCMYVRMAESYRERASTTRRG